MDIENKEILTFAEGCKFLGYSKSYCYKLTATGGLPVLKPRNGKIFFEKDKLQAWILNGKSKLKSEKEHEELQDKIFSEIITKALKLADLSKHAASSIPSSTNEQSNG